MNVQEVYQQYLEQTGKPQVAADLTLAEATLEAARMTAAPPAPAVEEARARRSGRKSASE